MTISTRGIRSYVRRGLIAAVIATAIGGAAGLYAVSTIGASLDRIAHSLDPLQSDNAAILQSLSNAEAGIRAYELTGNPAFLAPYKTGVASYQGEITAALRAASGDGESEGEVLSLQAQANGWLAVAAPLSRAPVSASNSAIAVSNLESGFSSFQSINAAVAKSLESEIAAARAQADSSETAALVIVSGAALLALVLAALFGFKARRTLVMPLEALVGAISRLRAGESEARVAPDGPSEVQAAGHALNALAERLDGDDRRRGHIRALSDLITRDVREHVDLTVLLSEAADSIGVAFGVDRVFVRLVEEGLVAGIAAEWHREGLEDLPEVGSDRPPVLTASLRDLAAVQETVVIDDAYATTNSEATTTAHWARLGLVAAVISPIAAGGELIGSLTLLQSTPRRWFEDEVGLIEVAAGELGRALQHAQLFSAQRDVVSQLQELDRSKSEFLSTVSHELRTPLTSITGYIEMLEEGNAGPVNAPQMKMLAIVDRNAKRLRSLIEDLLTLSRIDLGAFQVNLEPVDIVELIESAVLVIEPSAKDNGLSVMTELGEDLRLVKADRNQIERALLNLLANAAKFTPPGGSVTIGARREGKELLISVADTGIGIPPDELDQLSTRFFRASNATERAIPGTGLGLTIVRSVLEHHGGSLEITSELNVGTTFVIHLPAEEHVQPRPIGVRAAGAQRVT